MLIVNVFAQSCFLLAFKYKYFTGLISSMQNGKIRYH